MDDLRVSTKQDNDYIEKANNFNAQDKNHSAIIPKKYQSPVKEKEKKHQPNNPETNLNDKSKGQNVTIPKEAQGPKKKEEKKQQPNNPDEFYEPINYQDMYM